MDELTYNFHLLNGSDDDIILFYMVLFAYSYRVGGTNLKMLKFVLDRIDMMEVIQYSVLRKRPTNLHTVLNRNNIQ